MNERQEFMELIVCDNWKAFEQFQANQEKIINLFTSAEHVVELATLRNFTVSQIIKESKGRLQKLFTTPQQFFNLYKANANLATIFMHEAEDHFSTVFQAFDDLVDLALLDTSCALTAYNGHNKTHHRETKICDSLFELAAKECKPNLCLIMLLLIPMRNISQEEFDKLTLLMTNNPSIERRDIEYFQTKYLDETTSFLSSFSFFVEKAAENISAGVQWMGAGFYQ